MKIPETWPSVLAFAQWYRDNRYPFRPPSDLFIYETEVSLSTVIFRQGLFQVEIYLAKPNMTAPPHSHSADQVAIYLGGSFTASKGQGDQPSAEGSMGLDLVNTLNPDLPNGRFGTLGEVLPAGWWHALSAGSRGFIFLVCQKWHSKEAMYSTLTDWQGEPLGELHKKLIEQQPMKQ